MFNQGFEARLSVVAAVIFKNIGSNTSSNTPRINVPVTIAIKQCHKLILVKMKVRITEDIRRMIVWTPNGSGSSLAKIARILTIEDNINAFELFKCKLKS